MQDPNDTDLQTPRSFDECVRANPTRAILAAAGLGIAAGLLARALRHQPEPRSHAKQLLEEIRDRLRDLADPALNRLNELAGEGSAALKKGAGGVECAGKRLRSLGCKLGSLFH